MGRKSAKTGGAAQLKTKPVTKSKKVESESEAESDDSASFMQFNKGKKHDSDEEEDREVFNLAMNNDDSDKDSDEQNDDDDDDDDDSEYDSGDDADGDDLRNLVDNLPQSLRQKVLMKKGDEESESEAESEEEEEEGWGRKKGVYWTGDTADLEIGQDMADAEDEAAAALEMQKGKLARMRESDFQDDLDNDSSEEESEEEDEEEQNMGSRAKKGAKKAEPAVSAKSAKKLLQKSLKNGASKDEKVIADLELIALGKSNANDVQVERLHKDASKLSKQQRLDLIAAQSPELLGLVNELKERVNDLRVNIQPLKEFLLKVAELERVPDDVVEYLEVKEQLLLSYCTNVVYYLYMKAQGKSVRSHPVMKQLLKLRYVMEKMRPLDAKLKHQIDRLVKLSELSPAEAAGQVAGMLRPNPSALMARDGDDSGSEGDTDASEDEDDRPSRGKKGGEEQQQLYRAPKMASMPYEENESQSAKRDSRLEKQRKKLHRSELMETIREEFGSAPETSASGGISTQAGDLKALEEEADERRRFEEERFVRMTMSRKEKKSIKKRTAEANRLDNFDDIGDIGDFEEFAKMARQSSGLGEGDSLADLAGARRGARDADDEAFGGGKKSKSAATAIQRAVDALSQGKGKGSAPSLMMDEDDDSDDGFAAAMSGKKGAKKGKKSSSYADEDSDGDDPYAAMLAAGDASGDRKRRRAPDSMMDEGDDDDLVEEFGRTKKAFLAKKKEHYTAEPRYGGREDRVEEDRKRAATYEIMKNKGLTPHRKKEARNPRVMKRMKYEKAQIARKGQVRETITGVAGKYAGESTGVKKDISRSRRME